MPKHKNIRSFCEHLNWDNNRDCHKKAEFMCMCCSALVCGDHKENSCPYGGMQYIEIEETE